MSALLAKASEQLEAQDSHAVRRACWLARAALEATIVDLLRVKGVEAEGSSERAKLSCLEGAYADDRDLVQQAEYAWSRLSEACHQHAYRLSPTYAEARDLITIVGALAAGTTPRS